MAGEEGTGLHAFDDLDPVSTLSALNVIPTEEESGQITVGAADVLDVDDEGASGGTGRSSAPPPPPPAARLGVGALPLPPRAAGKSSFPPPPPRGGSNRSVPPPPTPRRLEPEAAAKASLEPDEVDGLDGDEDTRVVPNAFAHDPEYAPTAAYARPQGEGDAFEAFDDAATAANAKPGAVPPGNGQARAGIGDAELLELSATTVATNIDMDWDEEEVETKLRDDVAGEGNGQSNRGQPSLPSAAPSFAGNPSPFGPPRSSLPMQTDWEDEDEAMTKVMPSSLSVPPAYVPASLDSGIHELDRGEGTGRPRWLDTLVGSEVAERWLVHNRMAWIGLAAVLLLIALLTRSMMAGREPATVTLVTKPVDAQVLVDGKALTAQSSPFTAQGLKPNVDHTLEVRKDGFATETHRFRVNPGEVKPLPTVELVAQRVDTGFTLASLPSGATVFVDGHKLDQTTPVRIADLAQGLHVVRLEYGTAYQPWETQVALATGQVIELPTARLAPAAGVAPLPVGGGSERPAAVADNARRTESPKPESSGSSSSSGSSHHHGSTHEHASERIASAPAPQPIARPMPVAPVAAGPVPGFGGGFGAAPMMGGGGGSQGSLRVNSRPWSQVIVDGRMIGNTPQLNIPLPAGHHKVKLVNPQLGMSKSFAVDIKAGKAATKVVDLE